MSMKRKNQRSSGQGMVEFGLVLPIILVLLFGMIEMGFMIFSWSVVNSASREAARYGIAMGDVGGSMMQYYDCNGIVAAGLRVGGFAGVEASDFEIIYDSGPGTSTTPKYPSCAALAADAADGEDGIVFGDRIMVTVTHDYHSIAEVMGFGIPSFNMVAEAHRTIVKDAEID